MYSFTKFGSLIFVMLLMIGCESSTSNESNINGSYSISISSASSSSISQDIDPNENCQDLENCPSVIVDVSSSSIFSSSSSNPTFPMTAILTRYFQWKRVNTGGSDCSPCDIPAKTVYTMAIYDTTNFTFEVTGESPSPVSGAPYIYEAIAFRFLYIYNTTDSTKTFVGINPVADGNTIVKWHGSWNDGYPEFLTVTINNPQQYLLSPLAYHNGPAKLPGM